MSRELQDRADKVSQELKEALKPLREELNKIKQTNNPRRGLSG